MANGHERADATDADRGRVQAALEAAAMVERDLPPISLPGRGQPVMDGRGVPRSQAIEDAIAWGLIPADPEDERGWLAVFEDAALKTAIRRAAAALAGWQTYSDFTSKQQREGAATYLRGVLPPFWADEAQRSFALPPDVLPPELRSALEDVAAPL